LKKTLLPTMLTRLQLFNAISILGCPNIGAAARTTPIFDRGSHTVFIQGQRNAPAQFTAPIKQAQVEDPFEGSVHSFFDNMLNTRDFDSRFLQPHVAEGIGPASGDTFPLLDQAWTGFSSSAQYPANAHNLNRVDYMQVSHIQEVVSQNESDSYYLEDGSATCPPESDVATHLDQSRLHLLATDNTAKIVLDVFATLWEHGRAVPTVKKWCGTPRTNETRVNLFLGFLQHCVVFYLQITPSFTRSRSDLVNLNSVTHRIKKDTQFIRNSVMNL
jgi:hypothetical protein